MASNAMPALKAYTIDNTPYPRADNIYITIMIVMAARLCDIRGDMASRLAKLHRT